MKRGRIREGAAALPRHKFLHRGVGISIKDHGVKRVRLKGEGEKPAKPCLPRLVVEASFVSRLDHRPTFHPFYPSVSLS